MKRKKEQLSNEEKTTFISELMNRSFDDLKDLSKRYREAYEEYPSELLFTKMLIVNEAIRCKRGNEEQAWDFLS